MVPSCAKKERSLTAIFGNFAKYFVTSGHFWAPRWSLWSAATVFGQQAIVRGAKEERSQFHDVAAERGGILLFVCGDDERASDKFLVDEAHATLFRYRIKSGKRLVEDDEGGGVRQRAAYLGTPTRSARKLACGFDKVFCTDELVQKATASTHLVWLLGNERDVF